MKQIITKTAAAVFLALVILCSLTACRKNEGDTTHLTIYGIAGTSRVGLVRLLEEPPRVRGFDVSVEFLPTPDLAAARFITGEAKVGILPPNVAAKIYTSGGLDIQVAAVVGTGMLSLLSADPDVRAIADLRGRSVEVAGHGATPDYVFKKILRNHGLVPDIDVILGYSLAYPEIAQSLIAGRLSVALLPEPFATMALLGNPNLHHVADVQEEWVDAGGAGNYPMTVLVVDGAFVRANPDAVKDILEAVKGSMDWVSANPAEAGGLVEKHDLGLRSAVAAAAIPKSNYVFIYAAEAQPSLEALFNVFLENDPISIGGALPNDDFYLK